MSSRQLWGSIFIVVGVISTLFGIHLLLEMNMSDYYLKSFPVYSSNIKSFDSILYSMQVAYVETAPYGRFVAVVFMLIGTSLSFLGTKFLTTQEFIDIEYDSFSRSSLDLTDK